MAKSSKKSTGEFCVLFNETTKERKACSVVDSSLFFKNSPEAGNFIIENNFDSIEDAQAACIVE